MEKRHNSMESSSQESSDSPTSSSEEVMKPFKVVDAGRECRMGLTASSLEELEVRARIKFDIPCDVLVRVVLELDGTEIDDNDYFITLEPDTSLMILCHDQRWTPYKSILTLGLAVDPGPDGYNGTGSTPGSPVEELIWRLRQDLSFFPWLTPKELDTIAKMDTDEMKKIVPDVKFLEFLQELSERYLSEKEGSLNGNKNSATSILNDPIKLIRMYSKSNGYLTNCDPPPPIPAHSTPLTQPQGQQSPFRN